MVASNPPDGPTPVVLKIVVHDTRITHLMQLRQYADDPNARGREPRLDPGRIRRCARRECDLVFYDTTRSRTRRWHAEDPCAWLERQHARRHSG